MPTMSVRLAVLLAGTSLLAACASRDEVAALRQPPMPPLAVAKASPARPYYRNVTVQAVEGAPEFRWFDGGDIITTRPTRAEVAGGLNRHLLRAEMLAPSRLDAEYMLYTTFEDLRGPNVWWGTDKLATARVTFRLVRWRTGQLVREKTVEAGYRVHWTGATPEIARSALGGALLGVGLGYYVNQNHVVSIADAPIAGVIGGLEAASIGGPDRWGPGFATAFSAAAATGAAAGRFTDLEAMLAGGVIGAAGAAAGPVPVPRQTAADSAIPTTFNGTVRRAAATRGLMDLAFDIFMNDLSRDGSVVYKTAVSCRALNGDAGRGPFLAETATAYGADCPGAMYNDAKTAKAFPSKF